MNVSCTGEKFVVCNGDYQFLSVSGYISGNPQDARVYCKKSTAQARANHLNKRGEWQRFTVEPCTVNWTLELNVGEHDD